MSETTVSAIHELQQDTVHRVLFQESADAILIIEDDRFVDFNDATLRMLGYSSKRDLLNSHPAELSPERQSDGRLSEEKANAILAEFKEGSIRFEWDHMRRNGEVFPVEVTMTAVPWRGRRFLHVVWRDITERKRAEAELGYQASHDSLTGLFNRREFEGRVNRLVSAARETGGQHALCYLDLDQFKVINDTWGHAAGDQLLMQLSPLVRAAVRDEDTLARLGGDEFGILLPECGLAQGEEVARRVLETVQDFRFSWEGRHFRIGASLGLVAINDLTPNVGELLKNADSACFVAKELGRNRVHVYQPDDAEMVNRQSEMHWVSRLTSALEEDRFALYCQVIEPLGADVEPMHEVLIRLREPAGGVVAAGAFLPSAERYNVISDLDRWVVRNTIDLLRRQRAAGTGPQPHLTVNLSGQSITDPAFLAFVTGHIDGDRALAQQMCFEITETAAVANLGRARQFIDALRREGCRFALDDFGSGMASFAYLKTLPVDYLKIDGMFVKDIVTDPIDRAMVRSIDEVAKIMGIETIAEFVEDDTVRDALADIGVDHVQGFGIERPHPLTDLLR